MKEYDAYLNATHDEAYEEYYGDGYEAELDDDFYDDEPPEPDYEAQYDAMGV